MIIGDLRRFVETDTESDDQLKRLVTEIAAPLYGKLGFDQLANEPEQDTKLRANILSLLGYADHPEVIERSLLNFREADDALNLASETRAVIFAVVSKHGSGDDFERLLTIHGQTVNAELRDDVTSGLCATRDTTRIGRLLERMTDNELVKRQDLFRWYIYLLRNRYARDQTWQWMVNHWAWIEDTFKGDKSYDDFARYSANVLSTRDWLDTYRTFFEPLKPQAALTRAIEIGETEIASRVEWLERDGDAVRSTLAQQTA